jgi:hypothetical protein
VKLASSRDLLGAPKIYSAKILIRWKNREFAEGGNSGKRLLEVDLRKNKHNWD